MSKGITFDASAGRIEIINGARTVATTDGTLVNLLPTLETFTGQTATFPDFQKNNMYIWGSGENFGGGAGTFRKAESCITYITAKAEEYSDVDVLMAAPAGADFFVGEFKISRTTAPASTWMGRNLSVLPIQSQWMPIMGSASALLEAEIGMARALHIYITGGNLVMEVQQSVGPPPGYNALYSSSSGGLSGGGATVNGSNTASGANCGIPIYYRDSKAYGYSTNPTGGAQSDTTLAGPDIEYRWDGGHPCARNDTTSYTSIYNVDIRGRCGRRS